jgi:hypothetical protein
MFCFCRAEQRRTCANRVAKSSTSSLAAVCSTSIPSSGNRLLQQAGHSGKGEFAISVSIPSSGNRLLQHVTVRSESLDAIIVSIPSSGNRLLQPVILLGLSVIVVSSQSLHQGIVCCNDPAALKEKRDKLSQSLHQGIVCCNLPSRKYSIFKDLSHTLRVAPAICAQPACCTL